MSRKKKVSASHITAKPETVTVIRHSSKRKNLPPAGLESQGRIEDARRVRHEYNPHLSPTLRFSTDAAEADRLPELLAMSRQRALSADETKSLADALRRHEPWLEWSGKREKP